MSAELGQPFKRHLLRCQENNKCNISIVMQGWLFLGAIKWAFLFAASLSLTLAPSRSLAPSPSCLLFSLTAPDALRSHRKLRPSLAGHRLACSQSICI